MMRSSWRRSPQRRWGSRIFQVAMIAAIVAAIIDLNPTSSAPPATQSAAESFASAATAAFAGTELSSNPNLTAAQRSAGIPTDPVASWDIPTSGGRHVQLVLPGGLGAGQVTPGGQVVYPDRGAGFDVMAENTGTSRRTITRIPSAPAPLVSGIQPLPVVTMFVRTPADTSMFARTDGVLTVNETTPGKKPIAAIAPATARDAHGAVVPSGFVTTQIKPGLYLLSQVITPGPDTAFPVYADPAWLDSLVDTVASATETAVNFVKANPVESIEIVAGGVMVATGVGTGFGVGLIADGATSLVQKAGEATGNTGLQATGTTMEVLGYFSPTRALRKGLTDIAEREIEQLGKKELDDVATGALGHADDVTVIKPVTPSAPPKLPDPAAAKPADLPTTPGVDTPKIPTGPPAARAPESVPPGGGIYRIDNVDDIPKYTGQSTELPRRIRDHIRSGKYDPESGDKLHIVHQTDDPAALNGLEQHEMLSNGTYRGTKRNPYPNHNGAGENKRLVYGARHPRAAEYDAAAQRHLEAEQQRSVQEAHVESATDRQRQTAQDAAREASQSSGQRSGDNPGSKRSSQRSSPKKNKRQSTKHKQRKGQK